MPAYSFFSAFGRGTGRELYISDGTPDGVRLIQDLVDGEISSDPSLFTRVGDRVVFLARAEDGGFEIWSTDGTAPGTLRLFDVATTGGFFSFPPVVVADQFFLPLGTGELWVSDGFPEGTRQLTSVSLGDFDESFGNARLGDKVIFQSGAQSDGSELWITDGTDAGTQLLADVVVGPAGSSVGIFKNVQVGDFLYFFVTVSGDDTLWRTDGTAEGTIQLSGLLTGLQLNTVQPFGDGVIFLNFDDVDGTQLWTSDGTADGTAPLADGIPGVDLAFPAIQAVEDDYVLFRARPTETDPLRFGRPTERRGARRSSATRSSR